MSSKTYDQKCARAVQDMYQQELSMKRSYQGILRAVREHLATHPESLPSEVRAAMVFAQMQGERAPG